MTVHRILMMLLDFSWPSWGCFLRNSRLLLGTEDERTGEEEEEEEEEERRREQSQSHVRTRSEILIIQSVLISHFFTLQLKM